MGRPPCRHEQEAKLDLPSPLAVVVCPCRPTPTAYLVQVHAVKATCEQPYWHLSLSKVTSKRSWSTIQGT